MGVLSLSSYHKYVRGYVYVVKKKSAIVAVVGKGLLLLYMVEKGPATVVILEFLVVI
jgi:hypothetical protein